MQKLQRNYYCEFFIYDKGIKNGKLTEVVTVAYPTELNLNLSLGSYNTPSSAHLQFVNLSKQIQGKLWRDVFVNNAVKDITFNLYAGYGNSLSLVYMGYIDECISYRQSGSTEWLTEIKATATGTNVYYNGLVNATFVKGTETSDILQYMLNQNGTVKLGCLSFSLDKPIAKNHTYIGQPMDLIGRNFGDFRIFIDNNELHILGNNEVIANERLIITDETGLLGSPKRANVFLEIDMVFEPQASLGRLATLKSQSMPQFNKDYSIISIKHYGTISPTKSGTLITSLTLAEITGEVKKVPRQGKKTYTGETTTSGWQKPVKGKVTSPFGNRTHPISGEKNKKHDGIDIGANLNTPVVAAAAGKVTMTNWYNGYGKCVQMDNGTSEGKKITTLYGHLNSWCVKNGAIVLKGQTIGYVGSTGYSKGPHLHFEVRENGVPVDPKKYIGTF
ncbi:MAG: peptidoglycan DD-metalloendopeptidase family protein [Clostridia bacterium]|nr:peptidoglycan DD-metalloendopeptidase family protein [Clostridia bacterium]